MSTATKMQDAYEFQAKPGSTPSNHCDTIVTISMDFKVGMEIISKITTSLIESEGKTASIMIGGDLEWKDSLEIG